MVGYARVSTEDQNLALQIRALTEAGCSVIYREHVSGAARRRPQLDLALMELREGDVLVVWRLDRLARSLKDLLRRLEVIEQKGAAFKSLTEALDMTTATGRFMVQIAGAFAEFERQLTSHRSKAGMQAKMATGWRPGRQPVLQGEVLARAKRLRREGVSAPEISKAIKKEFGIKVSKQTIYNHTRAPIRAAGD